MKYELKRVEPLRAANIGALLYGLIMTVFSLIFIPFVLLAGLFAPSREPGAPEPFFWVLMLCFYPLLGVVMGWISGILTSATYNLIIRWTGGLLLELDGSMPTSGSGTA